jgi:flagellar biosynthesis anti-sigma factor FlgM
MYSTDPSSIHGNPENSGCARVRGSAAPPPGCGTVLGGRREVSSWLERLQSIYEAAGTAPDMRMDRVLAVKAALAEGSYRVSGRQVAASMLAARGGEPPI